MSEGKIYIQYILRSQQLRSDIIVDIRKLVRADGKLSTRIALGSRSNSVISSAYVDHIRLEDGSMMTYSALNESTLIAILMDLVNNKDI